ncbi:Exonuclease [Hathewaya proteolytica DSM 3090]|uniref:Exonuclease n=1 Tax=Hathewaya proteolytica DSM 3090 TaxID=1121331 RepID=A0A1M6RU48_9CLOT|nr:3'-5' exonuclease [Hathewaya proteolytica]SHK35975.1 Exonuclease [Hathewaya proteolytica DSM 3090]
MKSIFLDTETTGLKPGQIVQLTYIIEEDKQLTAMKNYFFSVDSVEPEAEKVHGFSKERLDLLSEGFTFKELSEEIQEDFNDSTIIAHNIGFDKKFIDEEFRRSCLVPGYSKEFCTMGYFKGIVNIPNRYGNGLKNPKLEEVVDYYKIDKNLILEKTKILFGCEEVSFHDARYDVMAMYMCCLKSKKRTKVYSPYWESDLYIFE